MLTVVNKIVSVCLTFLVGTGVKELMIVVFNKTKKKQLGKWPNKINVQIKGSKSPSITINVATDESNGRNET